MHEPLSDYQREILYYHKAIKAGPHRRNELTRLTCERPDVNVPQAIENLISRGYLKRNRAGTVEITTAGQEEAKHGHQRTL